jgi:serine phosphatase RsbU (regulator of sigma subunit)
MANLQLQAQSYLKSSFDLQTSEIFHSRFRLVSSDILCFAFREKKAGHSPSMRIFFSSLAVLGIFSFIIFCYSLKSADFLFSIKTRILSLMIFAAALPCLAFALIGYEYFHHKTNNLIQFHQVEGQRILKEFDSLYPLKKQEIAGKIEEISSDFFKSVPRGEFTKKHLDQLQRLMSRFKPAEFAFFDYSSNIWHLSRANQESFTHFNVLKMFLEEIIEGLINSLSISRVYIKKGLEGFADDFVGLGNSINEVNRIMANRVVFLNRLVFRGNLRTFGRNPAQIFLSWEIEKFQHLFLSSELQKVNRMIAPGRLMALLNENGSAYPVEQKIPNEIRRFFHEAWANNIVFSDFLQLEKRTFVASAIKGMNLESASLIYLYPRDLIENQIRELKIKIILGMALFLILATLLVTRFAIDRIKPVALLKSSLIAVAKQDFTARLNYRSSDEFNDLIAAFNVSIENMKDLALARTVQEGLLPPSDFSCGKIKVFAKTLFMTSMGGDYYDMTQTKNQILLAFGDVAGHGVPAALLMSMIKAIFSEHAENGRPQEFVQRCRDLMQYLKSRGDIRMMTLQFISIDPESGDYSLKNAGHCYPVHISNSGKQLDFIKAVSVPLGARTLPVSQSCKGKLSCGDYLILYSDGLVEALSPNGIMFGFARLAELFQKNFGNQPEVFCENILAEISGWNARQTDDLSILVLRFGE